MSGSTFSYGFGGIIALLFGAFVVIAAGFMPHNDLAVPFGGACIGLGVWMLRKALVRG